jgi:hypothetical protein
MIGDAHPHPHVLSDEEVAFCVRTGLDLGHDVDDGRHQYTHLCWPYQAYEGALCGSVRLWGHMGSPCSRSRTIDCISCLKELNGWMASEKAGSEAALLLVIIGRLAEAAECLTNLSSVAANYLEAVERTPAYVEAVVAHGFPETTAADLRKVVDADHERHRRNAESREQRVGAKGKP